MPYLGSTPNASFSSRTKQDFTANGSTTDFTLSSAVASANDIEVFVGNVRQEPTDAYTVNGTTLAMSAPPATGLNFYVVFKGLEENSVVPADGTISSAKIASSAVTDAKIAGMAASKLTGALPAISGAALTGISSPTKDYARVTFSGPNIAHNTVTAITPTLQAQSNNFTIANTSQIIPSVAGDYLVVFQAGCSITTTGGYTPTSYIYKNSSNWASQSDIINYAGGSNLGFPTVVSIVSMNGSSDYFQFALYTNSGATGTSTYGTAVIVRIAD
jgi:hypothetical protein